MKGLKIAVIGSGSTYTPELIGGFLSRMESLQVDSFYMCDINRRKNEIVSGLAQRMLDAKGVGAKLVLTDSVETAVDGADYVLGQVRIGGFEARILDEKIPLKYNKLGQETTGAGGFMKAMRTLPFMWDLAKHMERLAPNAWLINFTNPSGINAQMMLNHTKVKTIGLCNGPINMIREMKKLVPADTKNFDYQFVGLNHLNWITQVWGDGVEYLQDHLANSSEIPTAKNLPSIEYDKTLFGAIKSIPSGYLNYYYFQELTVEKCKKAPKCRGEECIEIEEKLLEKYSDPNLKEKPAELDKRGGALYSEAAVALIDSIENDKKDQHVVNVLNNGAYPFMADDDVVEIKCVVGADGAKPLPLGQFDNQHIVGLMKGVKAYERLAVTAGLTGDRSIALAALLTHPLVGDYHTASKMLDEMLEANRRHLPQFYSTGV